MGNNNNNRNKETNQRNKKQKAEDKNNWKTEWIKEERSEYKRRIKFQYNGGKKIKPVYNGVSKERIKVKEGYF